MGENEFKLGQWIYVIEVGSEVSGYIFLTYCGDYCICCSKYGDMTLEEQLDCMCEESNEFANPDMYLFEKSKCYETLEEAKDAME